MRLLQVRERRLELRIGCTHLWGREGGAVVSTCMLSFGSEARTSPSATSAVAISTATSRSLSVPPVRRSGSFARSAVLIGSFALT